MKKAELILLLRPLQITVCIAMRITRCQLCANCTSVSDVAYRQRLRSASSHEVSVPRYRLCTYGRRAFAVAGPTVWNSLPEDTRDWGFGGF